MTAPATDPAPTPTAPPNHIVIRRKQPGDAPESDWDAVIRDWARVTGWWAHHHPDSRKSPSGLPDWTLVRGKELIFLESKVPGGRLRPKQIEVLGKLTSVERVRTILALFPDDWPTVREAMR